MLPSLAQPSPAQPSPAQPKRAVTLLLALVIGLSAIQAHAAFEVRHYFGSSASHSGGSGGNEGSGPGVEDEWEPGEQRVVELSVSPSMLALGAGLNDETVIISGEVADADGVYDPSAEFITGLMKVGGEIEVTLGDDVAVTDGRFSADFPAAEVVFGLQTLLGSDFRLPLQAEFTAKVSSNSNDPGISRTLTIGGQNSTERVVDLSVQRISECDTTITLSISGRVVDVDGASIGGVPLIIIIVDAGGEILQHNLSSMSDGGFNQELQAVLPVDEWFSGYYVAAMSLRSFESGIIDSELMFDPQCVWEAN